MGVGEGLAGDDTLASQEVGDARDGSGDAMWTVMGEGESMGEAGDAKLASMGEGMGEGDEAAATWQPLVGGDRGLSQKLMVLVDQVMTGSC